MENLEQKCRELDSDNGKIRAYAAELERLLTCNESDESLPKPCVYEDRYKNLCLVYCDKGGYGYEGFGYYGEFMGEDLKWHILAEEHNIMSSYLGYVTHWMPFPKRP